MLVSLDFPQGADAKAKVPNPARNQELSEKYAIEYFPSVILMTADGEEYLRTSNIGAEAPAYLEHIRTSAAGAKKSMAAARALKEKYAKSEDKAAVVREAIAAIDSVPEGAASLETLAEIVRQGLSLDPENKGGLKLASLTALVRSGTSSDGESELAIEMDPANQLGLYELVVASSYDKIRDEQGMDLFLARMEKLHACAKIHHPEKVSMAFAVAAYILANQKGEPEKAKPYAAKALELGGLPEYVVEIVKQLAAGETADEEETIEEVEN